MLHAVSSRLSLFSLFTITFCTVFCDFLVYIFEDCLSRQVEDSEIMTEEEMEDITGDVELEESQREAESGLSYWEDAVNLEHSKMMEEAMEEVLHERGKLTAATIPPYTRMPTLSFEQYGVSPHILPILSLFCLGRL